MTNRTIVITRCDDCPFFDNEYYEFNHECSKLNRAIKRSDRNDLSYDIPEDCPLLMTTLDATT